MTQAEETIYQISTINNLTKKQFTGLVNLSSLRNFGDFGIGTLEGMDGELILFDNCFYKANQNLIVHQPELTEQSPFFTLTKFNPSSNLIYQVENETDFFQSIRSVYPHQDLMAIKAEGEFERLFIRSGEKKHPPYPSLKNILKTTVKKEFEKIEGTLVGFFFPNSFNGIVQEGFHFHFISGNHKIAGHLLEFTKAKLETTIDTKENLTILNPSQKPKPHGNKTSKGNS